MVKLLIKYFNSIKVQLELIAPQVLITLSFNFNSIKVQLELFGADQLFQSPLHFNSIKVQLEPSSIGCDTLLRQFQFHKGTIRTHGAAWNKEAQQISIP